MAATLFLDRVRDLAQSREAFRAGGPRRGGRGQSSGNGYSGHARGSRHGRYLSSVLDGHASFRGYIAISSLTALRRVDRREDELAPRARHLVQEPDLVHEARSSHQPTRSRCERQRLLPHDPALELSGGRLGGVFTSQKYSRHYRPLVDHVDRLLDELVVAVRERGVLVVERLRNDGDQERVGAEVAVALA